jgi:hypothetical protein
MRRVGPVLTAPPAVHVPPVFGMSTHPDERHLRPEAHLKLPLRRCGVVVLGAPVQAAEAAPLGHRRSYAGFLIFSEVRLRPDL